MTTGRPPAAVRDRATLPFAVPSRAVTPRIRSPTIDAHCNRRSARATTAASTPVVDFPGEGVAGNLSRLHAWRVCRLISRLGDEDGRAVDPASRRVGQPP